MKRPNQDYLDTLTNNTQQYIASLEAELSWVYKLPTRKTLDSTTVPMQAFALLARMGKPELAKKALACLDKYRRYVSQLEWALEELLDAADAFLADPRDKPNHMPFHQHTVASDCRALNTAYRKARAVQEEKNDED